MPIAHVYERVKTINDIKAGCEIVLEDGTRFYLPQEAQETYDQLAVGDKILIDCSEHTAARPFPSRINLFRSCNSKPFASFALGPPVKPIVSPTLQAPMWTDT